MPDPEALSTEYHKAHKQLMLWAGVLFIWELVGIDLEKASEAGGNVGAIIGAIRSPQAVPWVLLILVGYFLFKLTVEWYQCSVPRRNLRVARIDFFSGWLVALSAFALYGYQAISKVQLADFIDLPKLISATFGVVTGGITVVFVVTIWHWRNSGRLPKRKKVIGVALALGWLLSALLVVVYNYLTWSPLLLGAVVGLLVLTAFGIASGSISIRPYKDSSM